METQFKHLDNIVRAMNASDRDVMLNRNAKRRIGVLGELGHRLLRIAQGLSRGGGCHFGSSILATKGTVCTERKSLPEVTTATRCMLRTVSLESGARPDRRQGKRKSHQGQDIR